jgi:abhydrolase domain-containing protein 6
MKKILLSIVAIIIIGLVIIYFFMPGTMFGIVKKLERKAGGLAQKSVIVNGMNIQYLEGGSGDPLVLIHGFGANKDNWTRISKFLTPHFNVIAPDLPGFGESGKNPEEKYTIKDQAVFLKRFLNQININKSIHLGGNSMGGNIAGQYASLYQGDLKSLLLIAPGGVVSSKPSELFQMLKNGEQNPLVVRSAKEYENLLSFVFVKKPFIPRPIKGFLVAEAIKNQDLNKKIFEQIKDSGLKNPMESLVKNINVPTLIVWGAQDRVLHSSGAKILEAIMKNSKAIVLENIGHAPMIEIPEETAKLVLDFHKKK